MARSQVVQRVAPEPVTMTIPDATLMSGLGRTAIFDLIRDGTLESVLIKNRRLIKVASLRRLLEEGS